MARPKRKAPRPPSPPSPQSPPSSSSATLSPTHEEAPSSDLTRFTTAENEEWHLLRTNAKLLVEKDISLEIKDKFHLLSFFRVLRWENSFALPPYFCEELVREFYANVETKMRSTSVIWSVVRGTRISITSEDINKALDVPNEGLYVQYKKSFNPPEGANWKVMEATDRFGVTYTPYRQTNTMILVTSSFKEVQRLILYLLGTNILPRASGKNEVRTSDLYFLDKMVHGLDGITGINYGSVILNHMQDFLRNKSPKHAITYPMLISLVIERLGIDTSITTRTPIQKSDILRQATCGKMGIDLNPPARSSPPPTSGDAETSRARRAHPSPSLLRRMVTTQEALLTKLHNINENINRRFDETNARIARIEAHINIRPPSPPTYAPF
ncbi:hypothetical protein OROMI_000757 [Orobanche minor]